MSNPTMPLGTVKLFRDAVYYSIKWHPLVLALKLVVTGNKNILEVLKNGKYNDTSPLDIKYWSTTPYQYGNKKGTPKDALVFGKSRIRPLESNCQSDLDFSTRKIWI